MTVKQMYKYTGTNGEIISTVELPIEYNVIYRLIADSDKMITNDGENIFSVLDADNIEEYYEINAPIQVEIL